MHELRPIAASVLCLAFAAAGPAQEVELAGGQVLRGEVIESKANRVKIKTADGRAMQVGIDEIQWYRDAEGKAHSYAASLGDAPMSAAAQVLLAQLAKGDPVAVPELMRLAQDRSKQLFAELQQLAKSTTPAVRTRVAKVMAMAGTPESVRGALQAAFAPNNGNLLHELAGLLNATAVAALHGEDGVALVEKGLASKDHDGRFACAWLGAWLGSAAALPVLATFVGDSDHHVREDAAMVLAAQGNDAGAKLLVTMARRDRSPEMEANRGADEATKALVARLARRERLRACELLGRLRAQSALAMLRGLAAGKDQELAAVAKRAIERIEVGSAEAAK